jgi:hypothetical protein
MRQCSFEDVVWCRSLLLPPLVHTGRQGTGRDGAGQRGTDQGIARQRRRLCTMAVKGQVGAEQEGEGRIGAEFRQRQGRAGE